MATLKNVLLVNALSSGATGLLLIFCSGYVSKLFGVTSTLPFVEVGVFLFVFALIVWMQSRRNPMNKKWIKIIIALDILWVIESLIIILPKMFGLTSIGYVLIAAVAGWVLLMAILQMKGLKQTKVLTQ